MLGLREVSPMRVREASLNFKNIPRRSCVTVTSGLSPAVVVVMVVVGCPNPKRILKADQECGPG